MTCPKCKGKFKELKLKDTEIIVDICQLCYAVWFDKEEFWTVLQNGEVKTRFKIQGLLNKKTTQYKCPKCQSSQTFLEQGFLPMTQVEVEHCSLCESFLFDDREYRKVKDQTNENSNRTESAVDHKNLKTVSTKKESPLLLVSSFGCLAIAFMVFKSGNFRVAGQTKHWPKTTGKVTQSYIEARNTQSIHDYFLVKVSYDYQVGAMTYKGKNILKDDDSLSFGGKAQAELAISEFPVGKTVPVYYSPGNPKDAVLKPGLTWYHYSWLILSCFAGSIGLYVLFLYFNSLSTITTFAKSKKHP
ncbi:MAG: DUF3592 domain-containing protein [Oligoflexia bacterium]|nr:DUF3592 domain-containing protein [Oligoflexia bacterium]